jgi:hypothetical protein
VSERSLFYPRQLTGQGTGQVQSLQSYLEHLALSHNMKPRVLLETLLRAYPLESFQGAIQTMMKRWSVHGNANLGPELKQRLELATGSCLDGSTLERYRSIFGATSLTRLDVAYCPCCVQEDEGLPYIRLLWQVQCVTACPIHKVKLRLAKTCGAPASERLPLQKRPTLGGVCSQCGSVGFKCVDETPLAADREEIWVAHQVASLIAVPREVSANFTPESFRQGLNEVVQSTYGGSVVRASRDAGLSRASVCTWSRGAKPSLPWILQLCFHACADVVAMLGGSFQFSTEPWTAGRKIEVLPRPYTFAGVDDDQIRERLRAAAQLAEPPSLREFARLHGMHIDTPRNRFPVEARLLAAARKIFEARERERLYEEALAAYDGAAQRLWATGRSVTKNVLQREAGLMAFSQNAVRVRALETVLSMFKTEAKTNRGRPPRHARRVSKSAADVARRA